MVICAKLRGGEDAWELDKSYKICGRCYPDPSRAVTQEVSVRRDSCRNPRSRTGCCPTWFMHRVSCATDSTADCQMVVVPGAGRHRESCYVQTGEVENLEFERELWVGMVAAEGEEGKGVSEATGA